MTCCRLEREAFEQRLKERDDAKTRKMAEAKLSKEDLADIKRRQYETEEEKQNIIPELRCVLMSMLLSHGFGCKASCKRKEQAA